MVNDVRRGNYIRVDLTAILSSLPAQSQIYVEMEWRAFL